MTTETPCVTPAANVSRIPHRHQLPDSPVCAIRSHLFLISSAELCDLCGENLNRGDRGETQRKRLKQKSFAIARCAHQASERATGCTHPHSSPRSGERGYNRC